MLVAAGATLTCSFGLAPGQLAAVTSQMKCFSGGALIATITDTAPFVNIAPFGNCTSLANPTVASATAAALGVLTPMPCVPSITGTWIVPKAVLVGGNPAVTSDAKCMCAWGGLINVANPAQTKVLL